MFFDILLTFQLMEYEGYLIMYEKHDSYMYMWLTVP